MRVTRFRLASLVLVLACVISNLAAEPAGRTRRQNPPVEPVVRTPRQNPPPEPALAEIDRIVREFAKKENVPGIAYGVLVDGELVHSGVDGFRELGTKAPVTLDTVFRIASMTKSFTALAILKLRDEGKLTLDDPVERFVPELKELKYPTSDSPRITIRQLLSHSEGFPEDNPWGDRQLAISDEQMSELMRQGIPFSTPPGVAFEYSNYGFAILGRIVANVSGTTYADYMATQIFDPLGLTATTLEPASVPPDRLAHGYRWEDGTWKPEEQLADGAFGPMGGMLTSTRDLARYVRFLMSAWPPRDGPDTGPVSRASLREMQQLWRADRALVSRPADGGALRLNAGGYGYGLRVWQTCDVGHLVAHSGGLPGFGSHMRWLPEYGVGIIAMGNRTYTGWGSVVDRMIDAIGQSGGLVARTATPHPELRQMRDAVSRLIVRWDDDLAESIAADNLFLDESKARRRQAFEAIRAKHGECRVDRPFEPENALRGLWTMSCERGAVRVGITLSPTVPPRVQYIGLRSAGPEDERGGGRCPE